MLHTSTDARLAGDFILKSCGATTTDSLISLARLKERDHLEEDPERWLKTLFPHHFTSEFAEHHKEFWDWVWSIELDEAPEEDFIAIWPRHGGKSASVEAAVVALGVRRKRKYCLYLSETQDQADDHLTSMGQMIESSLMERYYPDFAHPEVKKTGSIRAWRHNRLWTAGGFVADSLGLEVAKRGVKLGWQRPDLLCPDDLDNEHDTLAIVNKKIKTLTRRLIPTGSKALAVICAQNLVHSDSIFSQLADGRATFLANRRVSGPHPAIVGLAYETVGHRTIITGGTESWPGQSIADCQRLIDKTSIESFLIECQHEVDMVLEGAIYAEWDEIYHVITQSEFARFFERHQIKCHDRSKRWQLPGRGRCAMSMDFGTTKKHPMVAGSYWKPSQGMPLTDSIFRYREMCRPHYPPKAGGSEKTTSRRIGIAIQRIERQWEEAARMDFRVLSHEASDEQLTFQLDMPEEEDFGPLMFEKWIATDRRAGIALAQNLLGIDRTEPHPFRLNMDGTQLMGRPRFYVIVPDSQGALYLDQKLGKLKSRKAIDEAGQSRFRGEIPKYRKQETAQGVEGKNPHKEFDDAMDEFKAMTNRWGPTVQALTPEERAILWVDRRLSKADIAKLDPGARIYAQMSRDLHIKERVAQEKKRPKHWLSDLDGADDE